MTACSALDKNPKNPTHYYCNHCNKEKYGYPKRHGKWDEEPCLTCGELLPRGCDWNDIPDRGEMCDTTCQYTILISKVADKVASYNMFDPNNTSPKSTLTSVKTVLSHAKINSPNSSESEKFVAYTNLEQVINIQYFNNGHLEIIPKKAYLTDTGFNLCYLEDQSTMLPPRSITKIDLKIAVEIPPEIMNNLEKPYTIESKEKIVQAIFLPLVKIGKFVPVKNHEELSQTTRGTFGFRSTEKGIEANFTETIEEKGKVIKTEQSITFLPYGKSEIRIKRTIKEKDLIFELYPETCQEFLIELTNLFIPADKAQWIKILIANTTEEPVYIPEDSIIGYLRTELENVLTP
ncbi:hypothetical protein G9A89_021345 [Geosiphon pyriformis]|nr:hypothetical protein G9A89_021345 [Geosiphon pyriformis]